MSARVAFVVCLTCAVVTTAQTRPDFSGTWTYDAGATPAATVGWPSQLVIESGAGAITIAESATRQETAAATYPIDGTESVVARPNGVTLRARATWAGDRLTIASRRTFATPLGEQTVAVTEVYRRAGDTLVVERTEGGGRPVTITYRRGTAAERRRAVALPARPPRAATGPIPRLANGRPDLQGYWTARGRGATDSVEPHAASYAVGASDGVVVDPPDGIVPVQPWAAAERAKRGEQLYSDPEAHCFPAGVPRMMYNPMPFQIIYFADTVAFLFESRHVSRLVRMSERSHPGPIVKRWMGDSYGYWDGDTLVIDSTNFNGKTWLDMAGNFVSDQLHVVERIWAIDKATLGYEATLTDPAVFTKPWTMAFTMGRNQAEGFEILEGACHEGNQDVDFLRRTSGGK